MMTNAPITPYRYAVYFAPPPDNRWWQIGSQWLGRCAAGGTLKPMPPINGISEEAFRQATAAPRRYGWHATLKAPFTLAPGTHADQLRVALKTIAASAHPFEMPSLKVTLLDDFLAIVPHPLSEAANALAAKCVTTLQPFAAHLSATELQRRRQAPLSPTQDALLERWGYPFVLDEFQLHCSLTGSLKKFSPEQVHSLQQAAHDWFANMPPCRFESLALFAEPTQGADFVLLEHFRLAA
jgi:putative phosphonate metabolism protein